MEQPSLSVSEVVRGRQSDPVTSLLHFDLDFEGKFTFEVIDLSTQEPLPSNYIRRGYLIDGIGTSPKSQQSKRRMFISKEPSFSAEHHTLTRIDAGTPSFAFALYLPEKKFLRKTFYGRITRTELAPFKHETVYNTSRFVVKSHGPAKNPQLTVQQKLPNLTALLDTPPPSPSDDLALGINNGVMDAIVPTHDLDHFGVTDVWTPDLSGFDMDSLETPVSLGMPMFDHIPTDDELECFQRLPKHHRIC